MATSSDLRQSELEKLRELLSSATAGDSDATARPSIDLTLSLLSKRENVSALVGRMIADALQV